MQMTAIQTKGSGKAEYKQLACARVSRSKNIVVSACSKGGFTIAQQLVVTDDQNEVSVFLKGAYHIKDLDALIAVRDALDEAIGSTIEDAEADDETASINWDES